MRTMPLFAWRLAENAARSAAVGLFNKTPRLHVMSYAGPPAPAMATARHNAYVYAPRLAAVKPRTAVGSSRLAVLRVCTMFHDSVVSLHVDATSAAVRNVTHYAHYPARTPRYPTRTPSLSDPHASVSDPHASLSDPHASLSDPHAFVIRPARLVIRPARLVIRPARLLYARPTSGCRSRSRSGTRTWRSPSRLLA